jgi:hypothetical protein
MVEMTPARLTQLARARELAAQARERLKQMTPEEKASHLTAKAATILKKAGKAQPSSETMPQPEAPEDEPQPDEPPRAEPPGEPLDPAPEPLREDRGQGGQGGEDGAAAVLVARPETPAAAPRRRVRRRIIIEASSSSDSDSVDEEILWQRPPRRGKRPAAAATVVDRVQDVEHHRDDRQHKPDHAGLHLAQLRALGLI